MISERVWCLIHLRPFSARALSVRFMSEQRALVRQTLPSGWPQREAPVLGHRAEVLRYGYALPRSAGTSRSVLIWRSTARDPKRALACLYSITSSARCSSDCGTVRRAPGLQVDDQLEDRRLLDRQIGGLGALQDLSRVSADQAVGRS